MALKLLAAAALAVQVSSDVASELCSDGECAVEESSLLAVRPPKGNLTFSFYKWGVSVCYDRKRKFFSCGAGECCGNTCMAKGDICCENEEGASYPCQKGGECCGNACAAPGSKCC